jgi:hypothetical protein
MAGEAAAGVNHGRFFLRGGFLVVCELFLWKCVGNVAVRVDDGFCAGNVGGGSRAPCAEAGGDARVTRLNVLFDPPSGKR